ncbi:TPA: hypothetical protein N0F65_008843 [Lagenidium giganteum]|uniref:Exocyst complex component Sec6 n=1 Tax=Lagenidium giganteum TaxID=4803 RepID=A0AAV2YUI6_9STRA|nr:TPA: hypothetical protein N0F65_008843 [Lagenidium giganteum]
MMLEMAEDAAKHTLVQQYELLLMRKHRFGLLDVIVCIDETLRDLQKTQNVLWGVTTDGSALPPSTTSTHSAGRHHAKRGDSFQDVMAHLARRLEYVQAVVPVFLGEAEVQLFVKSLRDFLKVPELELFWDLRLDPQEKERVEELTQHVAALRKHLQALEEIHQLATPITNVLTTKRNHLRRVLDESVALLQNSHSRRLAAYEGDKERLVEEFKQAVNAPSLIEAKQLGVDIASIETSMATMLLPHFEICQTIVTANAEVKRGASFNKDERQQIEAFVRTLKRVKERAVDFPTDVAAFVANLKLFERAASKDAFQVCSSVLKLQFQESVDEELFFAYVEDWKHRQAMLEVV